MLRKIVIAIFIIIFLIVSCGKDDAPTPEPSTPSTSTEPSTPPVTDEPSENNNNSTPSETPSGPPDHFVDNDEPVTCELDEVENGYIKDCSDGKSYFKFIEEETETEIIEEIDPCGDEPDEFDVLLFRLIDGRVILSYIHKKKDLIYFKEKEAGIYSTEDIQKCPYEITEDGNVILDIEPVKNKKGKKHGR